MTITRVTNQVSSLNAASVGLGNVTNESKATMFTNPTFTGTVSGVTATHVGLGNVTNESKATMFTNPTFTGTVSGVTATMVGLGNVANESKATMFSSPAFTGDSTFTTGAQGTSGVTIGSASGYYLAIKPNLGQGSYNPTVQTGDSALIFSAGSSGTGALTISPWSSSAIGLRMATNGTITLNTTSTTPNQLIFRSSDVERARIGYNTSSSLFELLVGSTTTATLVSDSSGNMSIGTSILSSKFGIHGGNLGATAGNQVMLLRTIVGSTNANYLEVSEIRTSNGTDWSNSGLRIQRKIDATWHSYIQLGGTGINEGLSFGTGGTISSALGVAERLRITSAGTINLYTDYRELTYAPSANSSFNVDTLNGTIQRFVTNNNTTITLPASSAGRSFMIIIEYGGAHNISWAGGSTIKWNTGTTPTYTSVAGKIDIFSFFQDGTNTYGAVFGKNF